MDETVFTKLSIQNREYSSKNTNQTVDQKQVYTGYKCAIATISASTGLESFKILDRAFKKEDIISYL